jgi:hypothetical protein
MTVCMDTAGPAIDWDDLFSDDLLPELAFPALLPGQPPRLAGVSTPDQCTRSPSASFRLGSPSDLLLQQRSEALAGGTGTSVQPTWHSLSRWSQGSAALPVAPPASQASSRLANPGGLAGTARRPGSEPSAPGAQSVCSSSKRQRTGLTEEKERRRQQNLKDQRAYRARVKVPCRAILHRCHAHCTVADVRSSARVLYEARAGMRHIWRIAQFRPHVYDRKYLPTFSYPFCNLILDHLCGVHLSQSCFRQELSCQHSQTQSEQSSTPRRRRRRSCGRASRSSRAGCSCCRRGAGDWRCRTRR